MGSYSEASAAYFLAKHQRNTRTDPATKFNDIQFIHFALYANIILYVYLHRSYYVDSYAGIVMNLAGIDCTVLDFDKTTEVVVKTVRCEKLAVAVVD